MPVYIIEHLEPQLWKWCLIEYKHISKIVGKENLWFTNTKKCKAFRVQKIPKGFLRIKKENKELKKYGKVIKQSVNELNLKNACILDPEAEKTLTQEDTKNFKYLIFGGILGNYPPKKRTKEELTSKFKDSQTRNIGKEQMSTDNAVYVVHEIQNGVPLEKMQFKDTIEIETGKCESVILPYRYRMIKGKPIISKELVKHLKKRNSF